MVAAATRVPFRAVPETAKPAKAQNGTIGGAAHSYFKNPS
jgi:hypothetical protein